MRTLTRSSAVLLIGGTLALAQCSAGAPTTGPGTPSSQRLTLTLATADDSEELSSTQTKAFAQRVADLTGGSITVLPDWQSNGDVPDWDQAAAQLVIDGKHELGLIPTRAWDSLGVTSLQALSTPMLIDNRALEIATITDSDIATQLMGGLKKIGVTGLALYPEELRHPFGFAGPLLTPDQFVGGSVRVPTSKASTLLYETLGATAVDDEPDPSTQLGMDSDYSRDPQGIATANVALYPKVNVLVVNSEAWADLTTSQQETLQAAADATVQDAIDGLPDETTAARTWCTGGGQIAAATPEQLAAFKAAVAPVRSQLSEDPTTAKLIGMIDQLAVATPAEPPVTSCPQ